MTTEGVLEEVKRERANYPDDNESHPIGWMTMIGDKLHYDGGDKVGARLAFLEIAALAVAGVESIDREGEK